MIQHSLLTLVSPSPSLSLSLIAQPLPVLILMKLVVIYVALATAGVWCAYVLFPESAHLQHPGNVYRTKGPAALCSVGVTHI